MTRNTRRILFTGTIATAIALILVYPLVRLVSLTTPHIQVPALILMTMFALPFAIRLLTQSAQSNWSRRIAAFLMTYVGCSFVALALLIPGELIRFIFVPDDRVLGWCLVGLTTCVCAYGIVNAMRFEIRILDVNAPTHVRGRTFVQISDVHVGSRSPRILRDIVRRTNELDPDMVFITGDLIDMHGIVEADLTALADIRAPSYFCIGNHERYVDLEAICERLRRLDIRVLRNESDLAPPLQITGIDDAESREQVATQLPALDAVKDCYQILLYHRPDGIDAASAWGTDLMLTGHTHRGQIFPFYYLVKRIFPNIYGRYESANLTLYVSPGTGTWGPVMRIGSRCEISLIRLL